MRQAIVLLVAVTLLGPAIGRAGEGASTGGAAAQDVGGASGKGTDSDRGGGGADRAAN